jgi:hypothetical protein
VRPLGVACLLLGCAHSTQPAGTALSAPAALASLFADLRLDRNALETRLTGAERVEDATYQRETGLVRLTQRGVSYYLRGESVVVIRASGTALDAPDAEALRAQLGGPEATLRSRAGADAHLFVYAGRGLALSISPAGVDFVEVFPPTTVEDYRHRLYFEPGPFIR